MQQLVDWSARPLRDDLWFMPTWLPNNTYGSQTFCRKQNKCHSCLTVQHLHLFLMIISRQGSRVNLAVHLFLEYLFKYTKGSLHKYNLHLQCYCKVLKSPSHLDLARRKGLIYWWVEQIKIHLHACIILTKITMQFF